MATKALYNAPVNPEDNSLRNVGSSQLSATGSNVLWFTVLMTIARIALSVLPLVFILGAENWVVLYFVIFYAILFGINFLVYLWVACAAFVRTEDSNQIFGKLFTTWNPLRRFYSLFLYCTIDYAVTLALWFSWLRRNDEYLKSPNNSNTPNTNGPGFFSFQIICGSFIFSSVIYAVMAYQLMRSLRNQRQQALEIDESKTAGLTKAQIAAIRQIRKDKGSLVNIELTNENSPGLAGTTRNRTKRRWFTGIAVIWIVLILVYLFIYYYHIFDGATKMNFIVVTVFFWASLFFWLVLVLLYYVPFGEKDISLKADIINQPANGIISTAETNAELNYEMGGVFVSSLVFYFINIIFMIYAYVLDGPNKLEWNTVPKFNSLAVVQSPFFYVWVTNAALNTGAIVFFVYNFVTIGFVIGWGGPVDVALIDDEDIEDEPRGASSGSSNMARYSDWNRKTAEPVGRKEYSVVSYRTNATLIATCVMFAVFFVLFGFVIDAMVGGHFLAEHISPIAVTYLLVMFALIVAICFISYFNFSDLSSIEQSEKNSGIWPLNKTWYLSTLRTVVTVPVAYVLSVIILFYLGWNYFDGYRNTSDWRCILPTDPSDPPPYSSCNIYWAVSVLSLYCINLVFLVIACNTAATTSIRIQVTKQAAAAFEKKK